MRRRTPGTIVLAVALAVPLAAQATGTAHAATPGTVWTTGFGGNGQLGDEGTANRATFGPVSTATGLTDAVQVSGGREHVLALDSTGQVWAWGDNPKGQV